MTMGSSQSFIITVDHGFRKIQHRAIHVICCFLKACYFCGCSLLMTECAAHLVTSREIFRMEVLPAFEDICNEEWDFVHENGPEFSVRVSNPRTVSFLNEGQYTIYEISFKTNEPCFRVKKSKVCRRYSDFLWLRKHLKEIDKWRSPPDLPPRHYFSLHPSPQFIERRSEGLQKWIVDVVTHPMYLSSMALHLFLQTELPLAKIEEYLAGKMSETELENIWANEGKLYDYQPFNVLHAYEHSPPREISFTPDELNAVCPEPAPATVPQADTLLSDPQSLGSSCEETHQDEGLDDEQQHNPPCSVTPDSGFLCEEDNAIGDGELTASTTVKMLDDDDIVPSELSCTWSVNGDTMDSHVLE